MLLYFFSLVHDLLFVVLSMCTIIRNFSIILFAFSAINMSGTTIVIIFSISNFANVDEVFHLIRNSCY